MTMKLVSENIYRVMEFSDDDVFAKTTPDVWLDFWSEVFTRDPTPKIDIIRTCEAGYGLPNFR